MDLRYGVAPADMKICQSPPEKGTLGLVTPALVTPNDAASSILYLRMIDSGIYRMPPIGSARVDDAGGELIKNWIDSGQSCP